MAIYPSKQTVDVSVVIPAYNAARWIDRSLTSVLAQTVTPVEIIVVDDGSVDETADLMQRYATTVRYIRQSNSGPSVARNRGIREARSPWIAFLDADDEWLPDKMEAQLAILRDRPDLKWCGSACRIVENGKEPPRCPATEKVGRPTAETELHYFAALLDWVLFVTSGFVVRRSVFDEVGGFDATLRSGEDVDLWCRVALRHPRVGYCCEPCWLYYQDNLESASRKGRVARDPQLRSFCRNMRQALELGPEAVNDFRPYAKKKVLDNLLRLAAKDCLIESETLDEVYRLFPLAIHEHILLRILSRLPRVLSLKIVNRLRGRISL
jgi:glycosyltransferase involved in cell wall biosynthesis